MRELDQALRQLEQIESFCILCDLLQPPPVTLPQDPVRAAGLDPDIWHGLGVVGLWAAIDAFVERRRPQRPKRPLPIRLAAELHHDRALAEIEDIRHLYAHNFGGVADQRYFVAAERHALGRAGCTLTSGARFDGQRLTLRLDDLRFYIAEARRIISTLDSLWP